MKALLTSLALLTFTVKAKDFKLKEMSVFKTESIFEDEITHQEEKPNLQ